MHAEIIRVIRVLTDPKHSASYWNQPIQDSTTRNYPQHWCWFWFFFAVFRCWSWSRPQRPGNLTMGRQDRYSA